MQIYVSQNNATLGPYDEAQAQDLLQRGDLHPDDLACCEGDERWVRLSELLTRRQITKAVGVAAKAKVTQQGAQREGQPSRAKALLIQFVVVFLAIVLAGVTLALCWQFFPDQTHKLEGEVFIVTKGGQSIKLGLVEVALLPLEPLLPYLAEKKASEKFITAQLESEIEAAKADEKRKDAAFRAAENHNYDMTSKAGYDAYSKAYNDYYNATYVSEDLLTKRRAFPSGNYYFSDLPQPVANIQTDSDGKFVIEIPAKGEFALAARAKRSVGSSVENYFWLVKVARDQQTKKIMLSNGNLSSSGSPDSLIVTRR